MNKKIKGIMARLCLSWIQRARGKDSHWGFGSCMSEVRSYLRKLGEEKLFEDSKNATLHAHRVLDVIENELRNKYGIDEEVFIGNTPEIEELEEELYYLRKREE